MPQTKIFHFTGWNIGRILAVKFIFLHVYSTLTSKANAVRSPDKKFKKWPFMQASENSLE